MPVGGHHVGTVIKVHEPHQAQGNRFACAIKCFSSETLSCYIRARYVTQIQDT